MPLVPRDNGGIEEVELDGDTYQLKKELGWYERRQASEMKGISLHLQWSKVQDGVIRIGKSDLVPVTMDAMEDVQLAKLQVWLVSWSHKEALNRNTLKRLPEHHVDAILEKIEELEGRQFGPSDESPLVIDSGK